MNAVKLSDLPQDFKRYADGVMQNEALLVSYPPKGEFVLISKARYNELESAQKQERVQRRLDAFKTTQEAIKGNGRVMNDDEIMNTIRQYRKEMRGA